MLPFELESLNEETEQLESSTIAAQWIENNNSPVFFFFTKNANKKINNLTIDSTDITINRENDSIWILLDKENRRPSISNLKEIKVYAIEIKNEDIFWSYIVDTAIKDIKIPKELSSLTNSEIILHLLKFKQLTLVDFLYASFEKSIEIPGIGNISKDKVKIIRNF